MPETIEVKVARLEVSHEQLKREIENEFDKFRGDLSAFNKKVDTLADTVQSISKTLHAIKHWIVGGVLTALAMQFGMAEVLKKLFL